MSAEKNIDLTCTKNATIGDYARIVHWLSEGVGPNDPRGFDASPMFRFACRYNLLQWKLEHIYREYVRYQCHVYTSAAEHLPDEVLKNSNTVALQEWFESVCKKS